MTRRYSSTAQPTTLAGDITDSATSITVAATTGFPAVEFVLALDYGTGDQELVLVTNVSGTTLTVTRGFDSTTAVAHSLGAAIRHVHSGDDFRTSRTHEEASTGVHGVTGSVVGTTDAQAMTNKDLSSATNTFPSTLATDAEVSTAADAAQAAAEATAAAALSTHTADTTTHGTTGNVVGTSDIQTLTNKTIDLTVNTVTGTTAEFNAANSDGDFATLGGTETLTNKTLTSPTVTGLTLDSVSVSGAWTAYTPELTGATSDPVLNDGTITGHYMQIGKTVLFEVVVTMGPSTTFGSGQYRVSLPVAATARSRRFVVDYFDVSTGGALLGSGRLSSGLCLLYAPSTSAGAYDRATTSASPFAFASGDIITISGWYEAS